MKKLSGHCPTGTVERVTCWPAPDAPNNIDMTTGMLGLTDTEENQNRRFPDGPHRWVHYAVSRYQYLHGHMYDGWYGGDSRQ